MKSTTSKIWVSKIIKRETAADILDRVIARYQKDIAKPINRSKYVVREFPVTESVDMNGSEIQSPMFILTAASIGSFCSLVEKLEKESKEPKKEEKAKKALTAKQKSAADILESIRKKSKKKKRRTAKRTSRKQDRPLKEIVDSTYWDFCMQIERTIGAPNITSKYKIISEINLRSAIEIKERLDRFVKREKFELKSLREICPDITSTQNRSTKAAITILKWLYKDGEGRSQESVVKKLWQSIYDEIKDKLFYIRRHPRERLLHRCSDDGLIETLQQMEWMFVDGNPFATINTTRTKVRNKNELAKSF